MKKKASLLVLFLSLLIGLPKDALAVFGAGVLFEINGGGSDTNNGGGFDPGATMATDLTATTATGVPVVASASYNFVAGDVGAYLFVQSGTNWIPGWYKIASVASNAATLTATVGSAVLYNGATPLNTTTGCATAGNPSPTGGVWSVDYSRGTGPIYSYTDMVIDATTNTKFTSAGHPVGPNIVGNLIAVTSGTGFTNPARVEVLSVSGTTATCDVALGTTSSTGGHGGLGGALASPGKWGLIVNGVINGTTAYCMGSHTFNLTNSVNSSGVALGQAGSKPTLIGYTVNRVPYNTDANRPVFQSTGANGYTLVALQGGSVSLHCIDFENGNAGTTIVGFDDGGNNNSYVWYCKFNALSVALKFSSTSMVRNCWIESCTSGSTCITGNGDRTYFQDNVVTGCTTVVFAAQVVTGNVFYSNGSTSSGLVNSCRTFDRNLIHTVTGTSSVGVLNGWSHSNSILWTCSATTATAINPTVTDNTVEIINCAFGGNTKDVNTGSNVPGFRVVGKLILTADPCTSASTGDFSLNNTAGGGAVLRAAGFPVTFANGLTSNFLDVGPQQHLGATPGIITNPGKSGGKQ